MDTLQFSYNWNKKLDGKCFTTLRLWNETKYSKGQKFAVRIGTEFKPTLAEVIDVKALTLDQLNEWILRLDTGYSLEEGISMIKMMYKNKGIDWNTQRLAFVLLAYTKQPFNTKTPMFS